MDASSRFTRAAADWLRYRNWTGTREAPRLGEYGVTPRGGGYQVVKFAGNSPQPLGRPWGEPEHAKRYVEHLFNFGHPPTLPAPERSP